MLAHVTNECHSFEFFQNWNFCHQFYGMCGISKKKNLFLGNFSDIRKSVTHECFNDYYHYYYDAVDGSWGTWSEWGACSVTCNYGVKTRARSCDNPSPQYGGNQCSGNGENMKNCVEAYCPGLNSIPYLTARRSIQYHETARYLI